MAIETIDSKLCPACNKTYTYLKYKYEAGELIGGYIASFILFLFAIAIIYFNPFVGTILIISSILIFRTASGVIAGKAKSFYWYCHQCDIEFHDNRLVGKTIYHSKKPTRYEMLTKSVQKSMQKNK